RKRRTSMNIPNETPKATEVVRPIGRPVRILDATEAAAIVKMDSRTLIRWARLGYVPAHPLGEGKRKLWRFLEHELLEWVETRETEKKRPPTSTIKTAIGAHARRTA